MAHGRTDRHRCDAPDEHGGEHARGPRRSSPATAGKLCKLRPVNERTLSRRLATGVVEALKSHGHILVVKGGTAALARELDELMVPSLVIVEPRLGPRSPIAGEPTQPFGDEAIDSAVEDMVAKLTRALMSSDHVEDVFAEISSSGATSSAPCATACSRRACSIRTASTRASTTRACR